MSLPEPSDDSRPTPPLRPGPGDCCRGGCDPCIFDLYEDELARHEAVLEEWKKSHPGK